MFYDAQACGKEDAALQAARTRRSGSLCGPNAGNAADGRKGKSGCAGCIPGAELMNMGEMWEVVR